MEGFFFTIKVAIFSVAVLFALQLKIAGETLESRSEKLIYESSASQTFSGIAQGAIRLSKDAWRAVDGMISGHPKSSSKKASRETTHDLD